MADWAAFAGFAGVVLAGVLVLAHLSQRALDAPGPAADPPVTGEPPDPGDGRATGGSAGARRARDRPGGGSSTALLLNVAATQGLFLGVLAVGIWWAGVPLSALGLGAGGPPPAAEGFPPDAGGWPAAGLAAGAGLYALNEAGVAAVDRLGAGGSERLRESLAPSSAGGWAVLLAAVLPVVATFEELLFRGALVGGLAVGAAEAGLLSPALAPWVLVAGSSAAFALGHGAQGRGGVAVTGVLGLALGATFVLTWSLPAVVVAHYLVNALEFVVHEGLGIEWT